MRGVLFRCGVGALWFAACLSLADAQIDRASAERLLQKSGTLTQIEALPAQFKGNFEEGLREQRDTPFTRDEITKLLGVADRVVNAKALSASITATIAERLTVDQAMSLEAWYDSELGKRFSALEAAAAKANPEVTAKAGSALLAKLSPARVTLVKAHLEASRAADFIADLSIDMAVTAAFTTVAATSITPTQASAQRTQPSLKALRDSAVRDRAQVVNSMNDVLLVVNTKAYETVRDDDLKAYATMLNSPAGKRLTEALIEAFNRALFSSATELSKTLYELNKPAKK